MKRDNKIMTLNQILYTTKNLRLIQVYFQIKYRLFRPSRKSVKEEGNFVKFDLLKCPERQSSLLVEDDKLTFNFLNQALSFSRKSVDWSFEKFGMLWTYNLNYFDWLHQASITKEQGLDIISRFYSTPLNNNPIILHSYPTSLRIINMSKFISKWKINERWVYNEMIADLGLLSRRLEYHLLANHLLENSFALYIGGLITNRSEFTQKGKKLLINELKEQVLMDGMHYERSPMYHLIILERLLDALNFAKSSGDDLESILRSYAVRMTGLAMNWEDLDRIPMMQDSAYDIALTVPELLKYSKNILGEDYPSSSNELKDSGYRKLKSGSYSLFANVGSIGPAYQPGHAHADELNFELFHKGSPIIVDTGVSTYEKNDRRSLERSTSSHNCLVSGKNSSDVWSGFRVGKRATVKIALDDEQQLKAIHDGFGRLTTRTFDGSVSGQFIITDKLEYQSTSNGSFAKGYLHLHPDVHLEKLDKATFLLNNQIEVTIQSKDSNPSMIELEKYSYAKGYNRLIDAYVISYSVFEQTKIQICEAC